MNKARKFIMLAVAVVTVLTLSQGALTAKAAKVTVNWFVGLGTGGDPLQQDVQKAVVQKFNDTHPDIELKLTVVDNKVANDALSTLIAAGNSPDIVGPVGFAGANTFPGQWLDLTPLVAKNKVDLKVFPEALVNLYKEGNALVGLPFAVFPGLIYYNTDLFDEAGLAYPPAKVGDKYKLDGKEVDWSWDTLAKVAAKLTVDANGKTAEDKDFDPTKIEQFGFVHQYGSMRSEFSVFGGASVVDEKSGKVVIPKAWREEAKWEFNGLWKQHFMPTQSYTDSALLKPNEFGSGKVAMARTMLWFTCCIPAGKDATFKWDLGVLPSYDGNIYGPTDADTFRISKDTKNPDAAFTVLMYLLGEAELDLTTTYGAYPARPDLQDAAIKAKAEKFPSVTHWEIVPEMLKYTAAPGHESYFPNFAKGQDLFAAFRTALYGDSGKDMDVDKALDKLQADVQAAVDAAKK
jgi:multiple sugar transport system substrate-binding protein